MDRCGAACLAATVGDVSGPAAEGARIGWRDVPAPVRAAIEDVCGAGVVEARTQPGGFSPGLAVRVRCADGARFFVKAVSAQANPDTPEMHRQEARVLAALGPMITGRHLPIPRLHGVVDRPPWVALVLTDVAGRQPDLPWQAMELRQVVATLDQLADAVTALVCAMAGYVTERSLQPPPPGLPTIRAFQAAQATIARRWL